VLFSYNPSKFFIARSVSDQDQRVALRKQQGLFADEFLPANTFLGVYSGKVWNGDELTKYIQHNCITIFVLVFSFRFFRFAFFVCLFRSLFEFVVLFFVCALFWCYQLFDKLRFVSCSIFWGLYCWAPVQALFGGCSSRGEMSFISLFFNFF
jgi:hypothetical protein